MNPFRPIFLSVNHSLPHGRDVLILAAILILACSVRLNHNQQFTKTPFFRYPLLDALYYDTLARNVAAGRIVQDRAFFMGPLYPYLLGMIYAAVGPDRRVVLLAQIGLGLITLGLLYIVSTRLLGRTAAIAGALFLALNRASVFYEQTLLMEGLSALLILVTMTVSAWAIHRGGNLKGSFFSGVSLGVAALARASILMFAPVFILWLIVVRHCRCEPHDPKRSIWQRQIVKGTLISAAAFMCAVAVTLLPVALHNYLAERVFVLTTTNGPFNLYVGNSERADGRFVMPLDFQFVDTFSWIYYAERQTGRQHLNSVEAGRYWRDRAWEWIKAHPGRAAQLLLVKLKLFFGWRDLPQIYNLELMSEHLTPGLKRLPVTFAILGPLSVIGAVVLIGPAVRRRQWDNAALVFPLVYFTYIASLLPFFITARYRVPIMPAACALAGFALQETARWLRARTGSSARGAAASLAMFALLFLTTDNRRDDTRLERAYFFNDLGLFARKDGDPQQALSWWREGLLSADLWFLKTNIGNLYADELNDPERAVSYYQAALAQQPNDPRLAFNLARAYLKAHDFPAARKYLLRAIDIYPYIDATAYYNLGLIYLDEQNWIEAEKALIQYFRLGGSGPESENAASALARARLRLNKIEEACRGLEDALRRYPDSSRLWFNLGVAEHHAGRLDRAMLHYRKALSLQPDFPEARKALESLAKE